MKNELNYFMIEDSYGSNQDWFSNFLMKMGGCAAVTACDSCIYFARELDMKELYPFDPTQLTKRDFVTFGMQMKPYLRPRVGGVSKLYLYEEGLSDYLQKKGSALTLGGFSGEHTFEAAKLFVKKQIDQKIPIPYLLLKHRDPAWKEFVWHWFLLTGYEEKQGDFYVKAVTYGKPILISLERLWDTGCSPVGGMIEFSVHK